MYFRCYHEKVTRNWLLLIKFFFFVFRSLGSLCASRSFNCHETQNWGQRERWEKASHVHVHPRLKNSSVKLNFIKNSSNWIIRIGGSWFCAWRHSKRVIYMFKSFFFLFFRGKTGNGFIIKLFQLENYSKVRVNAGDHGDKMNSIKNRHNIICLFTWRGEQN